MTTMVADPRAASDYRERQPRPMLAIDLRPYDHRCGRWLVARRLHLLGRWTPLVAVRVRRGRASEGGTEI